MSLLLLMRLLSRRMKFPIIGCCSGPCMELNSAVVFKLVIVHLIVGDVLDPVQYLIEIDVEVAAGVAQNELFVGSVLLVPR
eukprot:4294844-Amphidinium_carterae.1